MDLYSALFGTLLSTTPPLVPPHQQALTLLRVLGEDRSIRQRSQGLVVLAIAYKPLHQSSEGCKVRMQIALTQVAEQRRVAGLPVKILDVPYEETGFFAAKLIQERAVSIYVCPGLDDRLPTIAHIARRRSLLTFTQDEAALKAGLGVALAVPLGNEQKIRPTDRPPVVVHLPAAKAQGADFDTNFLRMVDVLK